MSKMRVETAVRYAAMTDREIGMGGACAAQQYFGNLVRRGETREGNTSLAVVLGVEMEHRFVELGHAKVGPSWGDFVQYVTPQGGKLEIVVRHRVNSGESTARAFGIEVDPDDPRWWIGGVCLSRQFVVDGELVEVNFAGAASGDYGDVDAAVVTVGLAEMARLWGLRIKARIRLLEEVAGTPGA